MNVPKTILGRALVLLAPIPAVATGVYIASNFYTSPTLFYPNLACVFVGIPLAFILMTTKNRDRMNRFSVGIGVVAFFLLASTLVFEGMEGVRRWIPLGPLQLNASQIFSPVLLFVAYRMGSRGAIFPALLSLLVLVLQPDAGQTTALAAGFAVLFIFSSHVSLFWKILFPLAALALVVLAWKAFDPLNDVPHVEGILDLATQLPMSVTFVTGVSILFLFYPLVRLFRNAPELACGLGGYWAAAFIVSEFGSFPVPVLGAGASSLLGWYFTVSLLSAPGYATQTRRES